MKEIAREIAASVAGHGQYQEGITTEEFGKLKNTIGQMRFSEVAFVPIASRSRLIPHIQASGEYSESDLEDILEASWAAAFETGAIRTYQEKILFPLFIMSSDSESECPIEVAIRQGDAERSAGLPYYLNWVGPLRTDDPSRSQPGRALEQFAYVDWSRLLSDLAEAALDEPWDFGRPNAAGYRHEILKNYINYTFYCLKLQDKVCIKDDGSFAAFNSGLVDSWYQDIFVCFEPQVGESAWRYLGLAAKGNRLLRKTVNEAFSPRPQRVKWFDQLQDVLYDPDKELHIDYEHILLDNIKRFPLAWVLSALDASDAENFASDENMPHDDAYFSVLSDFIANDYRAYENLRAMIESAVKLAHRRISWNYKAAIPSYYPKGNSMSFLLPLCLQSPEKADAALVVELLPSGAYQGVTVLDMEMAYKDARLICRPDSDWLNAALI